MTTIATSRNTLRKTLRFEEASPTKTDGRRTNLVAATFTPMHDDGSLDLDQVGPVVDHLHHQGIAGLYVVGSTGEGASLSGRERRQTVEAFVQAAAGRMPVVVQVGQNSLTEAREAASHAEHVGAMAISATPPSYYKTESVEVLIQSVASIAAAAPSLPFYYYHIPHLTGVGLDMLEFLKMAGDQIPTLVGVKYTASTLCEMLRCIELQNRRFEILSGRDDMLLASLAVGAMGAVGSTYNFAAPLYRRLIAALQAGNLPEARCWQVRAAEMLHIAQRYHGFSGQKAVMKMVGLDCGPTRLPLAPLSAEEVNRLHHELDAIGFFGWLAGE